MAAVSGPEYDADNESMVRSMAPIPTIKADAKMRLFNSKRFRSFSISPPSAIQPRLAFLSYCSSEDVSGRKFVSRLDLGSQLQRAWFDWGRVCARSGTCLVEGLVVAWSDRSGADNFQTERRRNCLSLIRCVLSCELDRLLLERSG